MDANAAGKVRRLRGAHGAALVTLTVAALAYGTPASAAGTFKAADHDWVVALNQATLHSVPSGGIFRYCATEEVSAITPSVTYSGAPVGQSYREEVVGPPAAGSFTIMATTNVDGDRTPLRFARASGSWDNTYAVMSFPGTEHKATLPPGVYSFAVVLAGTTIAKTSVRLATRRC
jgi:hypothetical protein